MDRIFQLVPLYLESDTEAKQFFSDSNLNDLETLTGDRILLYRPDSSIGLFEEAGKARYPGLQSRDLPCLWAEAERNAHFQVPIRELRIEHLRDIICDLSDAAAGANNLAEWQSAFLTLQSERKPKAVTPAHSKSGEEGEMRDASGDKVSDQDGQSGKLGWTLGWGKVAGIGGLALALVLTVLTQFKFPVFPAQYVPALLILLYGIAVLGCVIWMVEKLTARTGPNGARGAVALPVIFLVFGLGLGVFAFLTLPKPTSGPEDSQNHNPKSAKDEPEIHGIVLDAQGKAAGRALVSVVGYGQEATFTNATGSFVLPSHAERLGLVDLHAERPPDGPAKLEGYIVGSGPATLRLDPVVTGGKSKPRNNAGRPKPGTAVSQSVPSSTQGAGTIPGSTPGGSQAAQGPCDSFQQFMGSETAMATLAEKAFSRKNYPCVVTYLEQAKKVQSSGVWERDYPFFAASYLLARNDRARFQSTLDDMLGEMRRPSGFLHHGPSIGIAISNLSEVRPYLNANAQASVDNAINEATAIRSNMPN